MELLRCSAAVLAAGFSDDRRDVQVVEQMQNWRATCCRSPRRRWTSSTSPAGPLRRPDVIGRLGSTSIRPVASCPGACLSRDRLPPTSPTTRARPRSSTSTLSTASRAASQTSSTRCRRRADRQDDRRRGHGGRRHLAALINWAVGFRPCMPRGRCRRSDDAADRMHHARCSTATATATAAVNLARPARRAARHAWSKQPTRTCTSSASPKSGSRFSEATKLFSPAHLANDAAQEKLWWTASRLLPSGSITNAP
jgi:hypothetical protein